MQVECPIHAMIDVETLGTSPGAALLSAGIVLFRPGLLRVVGGRLDWSDWERSVASLKVHFDVQSCIDAGLRVEFGTVAWWMGQSEEARSDAFGAHHRRLSLAEGLRAIAEFLRGAIADRHGNFGGPIWSHGASFDIPILSEALGRAGMGKSWNFRLERDTRTIIDAAGLEYSGTAHEPIADATAQARMVSRALLIIGAAREAGNVIGRSRPVVEPTAEPRAALPPRIRPLAWGPDGASDRAPSEARSAVGAYSVVKIGMPGRWAAFRDDHLLNETGAESREEAKVVAQDDFERIILSTLVDVHGAVETDSATNPISSGSAADLGVAGTTVGLDRDDPGVRSSLASVQVALEAMTAERDALRAAAFDIYPYLVFTIGPESPGHHPTMPSAVSAFVSAFSIPANPIERMRARQALLPSGERGALSCQNPLVILAGIKQFGLAADGADLRDLETALKAQAARLAALEKMRPHWAGFTMDGGASHASSALSALHQRLGVEGQPDAVRRVEELMGAEAELLASRRAFNAAIDFAITEGVDAEPFLRCWRESDWTSISEEWPGFDLSTTGQA